MDLTRREMPGMGMGLMDLDLSVGVLLLCVMLSAVFFGFLTVQCGVYFGRYKQDPWGIKATVAAVWFFELSHQIFATMWMYQIAISEFGNIMFMMAPGWRVGAALIPMSSTAFIVQVFYARRGYILNKSLWPFSLLSVLLSLLALGCGLTCGVKLILLPSFGDFMAYMWLQEVWFSSEAATDILVAMIVVYSLRGVRTGYANTERGVWHLITYTFSTGIITSIFAFTVIALFKTLPNSFTHPGLSLILTRIYSNSLLTSLNLRGSWIKDKKVMGSSNISQPAHYVGTNEPPSHAAWASAFPSSRTEGDSVQLTSLSTFNSFARPDPGESFMRLDEEAIPRSQLSNALEPSDDVLIIGRSPVHQKTPAVNLRELV